MAITIVSGLPRSGTSMLMRMLEAGGLEVFTDGIRSADDDNPNGYYEYEPVKKLEQDNSWIPRAEGRVLKVISFLLRHLPEEHEYKVLFLQRALPEVLASQQEMLRRRGEAVDPSRDGQMAEAFERHLRQVEAWLARTPRMDVLYVGHRETIQNPLDVAMKTQEFLGLDLDIEAMERAVDPALYRKRA